MSEEPLVLLEGAGEEILGQCPGGCGRAISIARVVKNGEVVRALVHIQPSCRYFIGNTIDTILAASDKLPKA